MIPVLPVPTAGVSRGRSRLRALLPAALLPVVMLAGCSPPAAPQSDATVGGSGRTFSAEEKRAAAQLSLGAGSELDTESTPYAQALACKVAFNDIADRLRQPGAIPAEQRRAIATVSATLDNQLASYAQAAGKGAADIARDEAARRSAGPDTNASARIVLACIRRLQANAGAAPGG